MVMTKLYSGEFCAKSYEKAARIVVINFFDINILFLFYVFFQNWVTHLFYSWAVSD